MNQAVKISLRLVRVYIVAMTLITGLYQRANSQPIIQDAGYQMQQIKLTIPLLIQSMNWYHTWPKTAKTQTLETAIKDDTLNKFLFPRPHVSCDISLTAFKLWIIILILIYRLMVTAAGLQGQWRDTRLKWSCRIEGTAPTLSDTGVKSALNTP